MTISWLGLAWLDESPAHANSDLGFYWRMGLDIGLHKYGGGVGRCISWGYLPHEDKYNKPTIDSRNVALIMKSVVYDGKTDTHALMDQKFARENLSHAWYDEGTADNHHFDRTTRPIAKNTQDFAGRYSWATAVSHVDSGRLEAGPFARQMVAGGRHGESWQHYDPLVLDTYKKMGGPSLHLRQRLPLAACARRRTQDLRRRVPSRGHGVSDRGAGSRLRA